MIPENLQPCWSVGYSDRERISFRLFPPVADKDSEGYDWIRAKASIKAGDFFGETDLMLTLADITQFRDQTVTLHRELKGCAEFTTIEGQVDFKIETDVPGGRPMRIEYDNLIALGYGKYFKSDNIIIVYWRPSLHRLIGFNSRVKVSIIILLDVV